MIEPTKTINSFLINKFTLNSTKNKFESSANNFTISLGTTFAKPLVYKKNYKGFSTQH